MIQPNDLLMNDILYLTINFLSDEWNFQKIRTHDQLFHMH